MVRMAQTSTGSQEHARTCMGSNIHGVTYMGSGREHRKIDVYSTPLHSMTRPLRLEFPNALYHVTLRGDRREAIIEDDDDDDRLRFLEILGMVVVDFN